MSRWTSTFTAVAAVLAPFGCTTVAPESARPNLGHELLAEHDEQCAAARACQASSEASCVSSANRTLMSAALPAPTQICLIEMLIVRCETGGREAIADVATWYATSRREFAAGCTAIIDSLSRCKSADGVLAVAASEQQDLVHAAVLAGLAPALVGGTEERLRWTRQVVRLPPPRSRAEAADARASAEKEAADRMWAEQAAAAAKEEQSRAEERNEQRRREGLAALAAATTALEAGNPLEARAQLSKAEAVGAVDARLSARIDAEAAAVTKKQISVAWTAVRHGDVDAAADAATAARELGLVDGDLDAAIGKLRERREADEIRQAAVEEKRRAAEAAREARRRAAAEAAERRSVCELMKKRARKSSPAMGSRVINYIFSGEIDSYQQGRNLMIAIKASPGGTTTYLQDFLAAGLRASLLIAANRAERMPEETSGLTTLRALLPEGADAKPVLREVRDRVLASLVDRVPGSKLAEAYSGGDFEDFVLASRTNHELYAAYISTAISADSDALVAALAMLYCSAP